MIYRRGSVYDPFVRVKSAPTIHRVRQDAEIRQNNRLNKRICDVHGPDIIFN